MRALFATLCWSLWSLAFSQITVPQTIWTFWPEDSLGVVIERCVESWIELNPCYTVVILQPHTLSDHIARQRPRYFELRGGQRRADWIRLAVLEQHGGFWIDASFLLTQSLVWVQTRVLLTNTDGAIHKVGSHTTITGYPVLENW